VQTSTHIKHIFFHCFVRMYSDIRSEHSTHVDLGCLNFHFTCPICDIIVHEQTDKYLSALEEEFQDIVAYYYRRWEARGYPIGHNCTPQELSNYLAFSAFKSWLEPRYVDIDIDDAELEKHWITQKIINNNK